MDAITYVAPSVLRKLSAHCMSQRTGIFLLILGITAGIFFIALKEVGAVEEDKQIQLPKPSLEGKISLEESIVQRRSQRQFKQKELNWEQIGQLLWAAQGITTSRGGFHLRSAPSAGALYPAEIYLLTREGLFHYLPQGHQLEVLGTKDLRMALADSSWGQETISQAPLDIIICAVYSRVTAKYGQRGIRYVHIEIGHIAQNIHLQAAALGLSSVPIGAFDDAAVKKILSLPKDHEPLYIIPIGYAQM